MPRPSKIDQLPPEIRAEIGRLRGRGLTIDQILDHLRTLLDRAPSRSGLGRHIHGLDKLGASMKRSRDVAEVLVRELGDAPESRAARLNIELVHSAVLDLFLKSEDGDEVDEFGKRTLEGNPEGMMMLAKTLDHLGRASKSNADFLAAAEKRASDIATKKAAAAVDNVARERGISRDTLAAIKAEILGVRS
jgi:hypothetical protein